MSVLLSGRHHAITLVPAALLLMVTSAPWAGADAPTLEPLSPAGSLADGSEVPTDAIRAPSSVSTPGVVAPGLEGSIERAVASASASGIPAAALSAYQRAETVINAADKSCNISWQLIAAIGRVESDHGRFGGNALDDDGLAVPGIYGIPLNGNNDTQAISDTDAGQYDSDTRWDRAVGPMQFIPSTWSVVGVDGDNDGKRNPQDIDDAALASAVYLCSGNDDLSTTAGQRAAIFRYNHSQDYVDVVLSFMNAYLDGDFTSVPNGTRVASTFVPTRTTPLPEPTPGHGTRHSPRPPRDDHRRDEGHGTGTGGGRNGGRGDTDAATPPAGPGRPDDSGTETPTDQPDETGSETPTEEPSEQPTEEPSEQPTEEPTEEPSEQPTEEPDGQPEVGPTEEETTEECLAVIGAPPTTPATPVDLTLLETLGLLEDYTDCMADLGFPQ